MSCNRKRKLFYLNDIERFRDSDVFWNVYPVRGNDVIYNRLMSIVMFCSCDPEYLKRMDRIEKFNVIPFCRIGEFGEQHVVLMDPGRFLKCLVLQYQYFSGVVYDMKSRKGVFDCIRNSFMGIDGVVGMDGLHGWRFEKDGDFSSETYGRFADYRMRKFRGTRMYSSVQNVMMCLDMYKRNGFRYLVENGLYKGDWRSFRQMAVKYLGVDGWKEINRI